MKKDWKQIVGGVIGALSVLIPGSIFLSIAMFFAWALLEWILSEQGQEIIDRTGYVPLN